MGCLSSVSWWLGSAPSTLLVIKTTFNSPWEMCVIHLIRYEIRQLTNVYSQFVVFLFSLCLLIKFRMMSTLITFIWRSLCRWFSGGFPIAQPTKYNESHLYFLCNVADILFTIYCIARPAIVARQVCVKITHSNIGNPTVVVRRSFEQRKEYFFRSNLTLECFHKIALYAQKERWQEEWLMLGARGREWHATQIVWTWVTCWMLLP